MRIHPNYYEIASGDIFYALRQFRNAQLINADAKQEAAEAGFDLALEAVKVGMGQ